MGIEEPPAAQNVRVASGLGDFARQGRGRDAWSPPRCQAVWAALTSPEALRSVVPGCQELEALSATEFRGKVVLGAGIVKGLFNVRVAFTEVDEPSRLKLAGSTSGRLGESRGEGIVRLTPTDSGTLVDLRIRRRAVRQGRLGRRSAGRGRRARDDRRVLPPARAHSGARGTGARPKPRLARSAEGPSMKPRPLRLCAPRDAGRGRRSAGLWRARTGASWPAANRWSPC